MALDLGTLRGYLELDSSTWKSGLSGALDSVMSFGGNVPKWMGVASGAIIAGGLAAAAGLYQLGSAWDDVEDTIRVGTGATGEALDGLMDVSKRLAQNVPADLSQIAPVVADLNTRLGLTGDQLYDVAAQILEAGRMLGEDIDIQAATGAFNAFGVSNDQVSAKLDYLWGVSQATGIGINDLASRLQTAAPITQQLGWSFEETAGMIGTFDKAGLDSQAMIMQMQRGLAQMIEPGEDASETFKRVVSEIEGFIETGDVASARAAASEMFGTRGAAQFVGALQSGALNMENLADVADMTGDTIMQAGADTMDFAEQWQLVQNNAMAALEPLGSAVFSTLSDALAGVVPLLQDFSTWARENPGIMQAVATVLGILAAAFLVATAATWAMNSALLANPITWIILAVAALIAIIVLLATNWDEVVAWISDVWAGFIGWITDVIDGFVAWWNSVWEGFAGWITDLWDGFVGWIEDIWQGFIDWIISVIVGYVSFWRDVWQGVADFFSGLWQGIVDFVTGVWQGFVNWIMGVVIGYVSWWRGIWEGVSRFFDDLWSGIVGFVTSAWNNVMSFLSGIPQAILDVFAGAGEWLYNIGRDILNGLWDGLVSIWNGLVGWIEDIGNSIADTFAGVLGIHSPSRVFRQYGIDTLRGYLDGVESMQSRVDARMQRIVDIDPFDPHGRGAPPPAAGASASGWGNFTYIAAEGQSLSSEEALFAALSSPRAKGPGA